jgi:CRISPR-associated protein Cas2
MKFQNRASEDAYDGKLLVLIIYDIIDNNNRNRLAKYLKGYGVRVQKSAFEAYLDKKRRTRLIDGLHRFVKEREKLLRWERKKTGSQRIS